LLSDGYHIRYCAFEDGTSDGGAAEECMINGRRGDTDSSRRNFACDGKLQKKRRESEWETLFNSLCGTRPKTCPRLDNRKS
jgi:hypothetical protein